MNEEEAISDGSFLVAHVTTAHRLPDNRILRKECRAFAEAGKKVILVGPGHAADKSIPEEDGVCVRRTPLRVSRIARAILGGRDVWKVLRSQPPTSLHLHDPELLPLGILWKKRFPETVVIYDAHEHLGGQIAGKTYIPKVVRPILECIVDPILKVSVRRLDGVVAATNKVSSIVSHPRSITVQNYPWLQSYLAVNPSPATGELILGYVGGLSDVRGLDVMLTLAERLRNSCSLRLAGPASGEDIEKMRGYANVEYYGVLDPKDVPNFLSECNVGLVLLRPLKNYVDAQPTKLYEYMASGIPFVASDFPYWRDIAGDVDCGIFVDPMNVEAIERAVLGLESADVRAGLGERGRALVCSEMSFETEAQKLVDFTNSLVRELDT